MSARGTCCCGNCYSLGMGVIGVELVQGKKGGKMEVVSTNTNTEFGGVSCCGLI